MRGSLLALFLLIALPACSMPGPLQADSLARMETAQPPLAVLADESGAVEPSPGEPSQAPDPAGRMFIRTASLLLEVTRVEDALASAEVLATELGGYLSNREGPLLVLRVPAPAFPSLLSSLKALGRVLNESLRTYDVSDQHRDLSIRLANAHRARERLLALLEKAERVEDILRIEAELRRLTEEIEKLTAELESLENRVSFSTITVAFRAAASQLPPTQRRPSRFGWINQVGAEYVLRRF